MIFRIATQRELFHCNANKPDGCSWHAEADEQRSNQKPVLIRPESSDCSVQHHPTLGVPSRIHLLFVPRLKRSSTNALSRTRLHTFKGHSATLPFSHASSLRPRPEASRRVPKKKRDPFLCPFSVPSSLHKRSQADSTLKTTFLRSTPLVINCTTSRSPLLPNHNPLCQHRQSLPNETLVISRKSSMACDNS